MKFNLNKFKGKNLKLKVKDAIKNGKNIYKNIKGCESDINQFLIDLPVKKTGLKRLMVCMNYVYPKKVNSEFKMTRGHKHNAEEVYIFLKGKGKMIIGKKKINVKERDLITVPVSKYHRVINTGKTKLAFLTIFEKSKHKHLKK
jgi:oxalate decarboxylase/phosphoglucose isomerase-like protein (cupin superfamily)